jgi:hypothetical protein
MRIFRLASVIALISATQFAIATPTLAALPAGSLVRGSLPGVYHIGDDGKRYVFPNEKTYFSWYLDFRSVVFITDSELATIPLGGNVTYRPGTKMLKMSSDPKVYAIAEGGVLRPIASEQTAAALYGQDWNKDIDDLPESFFTNYTVGTTISSPSDFSPIQTELAATKIEVSSGSSSQANETTGNTSSGNTSSDSTSSGNTSSGGSSSGSTTSGSTSLSFTASPNECNLPGASTSPTDNFNIRLLVINSVTRDAVPNAYLASATSNLSLKTNAYGSICVARLAGTFFVPWTGTYEGSAYVNTKDYTTPGTVFVPIKPRTENVSPDEPVPGDNFTLIVKNSVNDRPIIGMYITTKGASGVSSLTTGADGSVSVPRAYGTVYTPYTEGYETSGEINLVNYPSGGSLTLKLKPRATMSSSTVLVFPSFTYAVSPDGGAWIKGRLTKDGAPLTEQWITLVNMSPSIKTDAQGYFSVLGYGGDSVRLSIPSIAGDKQYQIDAIKGQTVTANIEI